jgi:probable DNA metabolism protein
MRRVLVGMDFASWRDAARSALAEGWQPAEIDLQDSGWPQVMDLELAVDSLPSGVAVNEPHVPKTFLDAAAIVAVHCQKDRWNLLYRLLYRLQLERDLMRVEVDDDVAQLKRLEQQVQRDLHKMHAFVRFRKVEDPVVGEHFIAWYRPDHRIVRLAAPFFAERFAVMRWTILTPDESVAWNPATRQLRFGPGAPREAAPQEDEMEELWRGYYGAIFNPARLNPEAMRSEMPVRYWQHLPEVTLLPELMQRADRRVAEMVAQQQTQPTAAPFMPEQHTLPILRKALPECKGCGLYKCATQVVPGAGSGQAKLMLVGEQPGDQEDLAGEPFVGPAGIMLRKALEELQIDAKTIFVTNAVKHFKFVLKGKRRLHENPRISEINACRPWLLAELDAVKPQVVVCLGASAAKSLLGGTFTLMKSRGTVVESAYARQVVATVHPSAILRARDDQSRHGLYQFLKDDLALAYATSLKSS